MPNVCWRSVAADSTLVTEIVTNDATVTTATNDDTVVDIDASDATEGVTFTTVATTNVITVISAAYDGISNDGATYAY